MPTVRLAKALKIKSRIARDVADLGKTIREHNCVMEGSERPADIKQAYDSLLKKTALLAQVKSAIHIANGPILEQIFKMSEDKRTLQLLESLDTANGTKSVSPYGGEVAEYESAIDGPAALEESQRIKKQIDRLQDEIDEFNAQTDVELPQEAVDTV